MCSLQFLLIQVEGSMICPTHRRRFMHKCSTHTTMATTNTILLHSHITNNGIRISLCKLLYQDIISPIRCRSCHPINLQRLPCLIGHRYQHKRHRHPPCARKIYSPSTSSTSLNVPTPALTSSTVSLARSPIPSPSRRLPFYPPVSH
jgi:hypothetical protein